MKLLILGATGLTGQHVVSQALDAGHDVTAYVRTPSKLTVRPRLTIVPGDLHDRAALTAAMRGQDAVISAIGRGKSFDAQGLIEKSVPAILAAMQEAGVRRLLFTSALGLSSTLGS